MTARYSIRVRLTAWYSAVLLLGLAIFATALWFAMEQRLIAQLDARLDQRIEGLRTVLAIEGRENGPSQLRAELAEFTSEVPEGSLIEIRDRAGAVVVPLDGRPIPQLGRNYRVKTADMAYGGEAFHVRAAASLEPVTAILRDFRYLLILMTPLVLVIAGIGGYWISGRALRPVDEITRAAKCISVQNLSQRLPVPRTGDEIERMSEAWNDVLRRLDSAVQRIRQFTADASHELRTPIALIRSTAELALRRERTTGDYRRALTTIHQESERMTELTEQLLKLARADSGAVEMPLTPVDLNAVVREMVSLCEASAASHMLELKANITTAPAIAAANPSAIRQLLMTLLENALEHTSPTGCVTVSVTPVEGGYTLSVEDTGEGIPPAALPHIFERFYRADSARASGAGVGLGLSIAQAIAHAHGSEIAVESEPGTGSRFAVVLRQA